MVPPQTRRHREQKAWSRVESELLNGAGSLTPRNCSVGFLGGLSYAARAIAVSSVGVSQSVALTHADLCIKKIAEKPDPRLKTSLVIGRPLSRKSSIGRSVDQDS